MPCSTPCCHWASRTSPCRPRRTRCGRPSRPRRKRRNKGDAAMHNFAFHRPTSVADAAKAIGAASDGKFIAGGQTLLPTLRQRLAQPTDMVDLTAVSELKGIKVEGDGVTIGAMTTHSEVANSAEVQKTIPGLAKLASLIGDHQVRQRGTIGGSIANNDPAADYPAAVLGLGATVKTNKREIKADDFFKGMFETALQDG